MPQPQHRAQTDPTPEGAHESNKPAEPRTNTKDVSPAQLKEMFDNADAAVAQMAESYTEWVVDDLAKLDAAFAKAKADGQTDLSEVFKVVHDMKGQGATFGYQLVTDIGQALCGLIEGKDVTGVIALDVIEAHIKALRVVIVQKMQGDGGDVGQTLLAGLRAAAAKVAG